MVLNDEQIKYLGKVLKWLESEPKSEDGFNIYVTKVVLEDGGEPLGSFDAEDMFWLFNAAESQ